MGTTRTVAAFLKHLTTTSALAAALALSACAPAPNAGIVTSGNDSGIIGGVDATGKEPFAKHVAALFDLGAGGLCTASIYSDSILVTAAHCVMGTNPTQLRVVFGTDIGSRAVIVRAVEDFRVSPLYPFRQNEEFNNGDIAVVKFTGGLPAGFAPVPMLADASKLADKMPIMLAGYGASIVKDMIDPKTGKVVIDRRTGLAVADHTEAGKLRYVTTTVVKAAYSKSEITVDNSKGKGACHGDSGGPAYIEVNGQLTVVGVTSRGMDIGDRCSGEVVYTGTAFFADWITRSVKALNEKTAPVRAVAAARP